MQFNLDLDYRSYNIRACRPGAISFTAPADTSGAHAKPVELKTVNGSLIISAKQLIDDWPPETIEELRVEHIAAIVALEPELILLGTGATLQFPEREMLMQLRSQRVSGRQVGVEIMDTAAACRTYNILMAEGRHVVAGLINSVVAGSGASNSSR
ncbi:MAG: Xcc1710-like domain-containing protein [Gammaproteobacteria bacterium]|nr:Xcc1710-like domain-containing protein [Gammaproteobacteria bacterium]